MTADVQIPRASEPPRRSLGPSTYVSLREAS